jgi:hypothetical protein
VTGCVDDWAMSVFAAPQGPPLVIRTFKS